MLRAWFPSTCLICNEITAERGLCPSCWSQISWLHAPFCHTCATPLLMNPLPGEVILCPPCQEDPSPLEACRASMVYNAACKPLLMRFKHARDVTLAPFFAQALLVAGAPLLNQATLLVPVPLHWQRLAKRSFNQAALLTQILSRLTGIPVNFTILQRVQASKSQGHLSALQRYGNLLNAFQAYQEHHPPSQRIVLIDDVCTSGATLRGCALALKDAGFPHVSALVVARALPHGHKSAWM